MDECEDKEWKLSTEEGVTKETPSDVQVTMNSSFSDWSSLIYGGGGQMVMLKRFWYMYMMMVIKIFDDNVQESLIYDDGAQEILI